MNDDYTRTKFDCIHRCGFAENGTSAPSGGELGITFEAENNPTPRQDKEKMGKLKSRLQKGEII